MWPHRWQPTRLPHPWDSPGKNTGVGCHFLLQCRKVKSESEVAQSCLTLSDPMDCSLPGSSAHGIFQARVLEWVAITFSTRTLYINIKNNSFNCLLSVTVICSIWKTYRTSKDKARHFHQRPTLSRLFQQQVDWLVEKGESKRNWSQTISWSMLSPPTLYGFTSQLLIRESFSSTSLCVFLVFAYFAIFYWIPAIENVTF